MDNELNNKNQVFTSEIVSYEMAEDENFCDITTRLCYVDDYNLNKFCLRSSEHLEDNIKTLINTPVVAYHNPKTDDFDGHMVKMTKDGVTFGTVAIGTHVDAWSKPEKVKPVFSDEEKELPCIYGKARIWKGRFPKYFDVLKRRMDEVMSDKTGKAQLGTSWELVGLDTKNDDDEGVYRSCTRWVFLGNAILGKKIIPAFNGTSEILEISESNYDVELSEALTQDIMTLSEKDEDNNINNNLEGGINNMTKKKIETSTLGIRDLSMKLNMSLNPNGWDGEHYYSISEIYPTENKVMTRDIFRELNDEVCVFSYTIGENDEVSVSEPLKRSMTELIAERTNVNINVQLDDTAKLISEKELTIKEKDTKIAELETTLSEKETELSTIKTDLDTKVSSIADLGTKIAELEIQVSELTPYKEKIEQAEREAQEKELAQKKENLKVLATKGGYISSEELETSEVLKQAIEELNEQVIKAEIATRVLSKLEQSEKETKEDKVETSSAKQESTVANLNNAEESLFSATDIIKNMLRKSK